MNDYLNIICSTDEVIKEYPDWSLFRNHKFYSIVKIENSHTKYCKLVTLKFDHETNPSTYVIPTYKAYFIRNLASRKSE